MAALDRLPRANGGSAQYESLTRTPLIAHLLSLTLGTFQAQQYAHIKVTVPTLLNANHAANETRNLASSQQEKGTALVSQHQTRAQRVGLVSRQLILKSNPSSDS